MIEETTDDMLQNAQPDKTEAGPAAGLSGGDPGVPVTPRALPSNESESMLGWLCRLVACCGERVLALGASSRLAAAVILEMRRLDRAPACQFFIAHTNGPALQELSRDLAAVQLDNDVLLYHGNMRQFARDLPIGPTLLCAEASLISPDSIQIGLPPGSQVLVLDSAAGDGCHMGLETCLSQGLLDHVETNGPTQLFRATRRCRGPSLENSAQTYGSVRDLLRRRYLLEGIQGSHTAVGDLTEAVRRTAIEKAPPGVSGYGPWPYVNANPVRLPGTLPGGVPWPKISIVTPAFNQGKYIEETILSVLNQGYPNVEHIIIDGGSSDSTASVLARYRDVLAYVVSEPDRGQAHAINKGMARSTGDILTWLNSDDMLAPGALAAAALAFHTSGADLVAGLCQLYSGGKLVAQHLPSCEDGPLPLNDLLDLDGGWNAGEFFYQPEVMFRRSLWLQAGGHVEESLFYSMDYELWVRFAEAGARIHVIGHPVAWFRLHPEQKTHIAERFKAELVQFREAYLNRTGRELQPRSLPEPPRSRLRIAFFSDLGFQFGAGIAHKHMAEAAAWAGHEVFPFCLHDTPPYEGSAPACTDQWVIESIEAFRPDLVLVGNIHCSKPHPRAELLQLLAQRFPTLCVLHDFWLLTGRCAYPLECSKYLDGCDESCPTPDEYPRLEPEKIAGAWKAKRALLNSRLPMLLANSQWTADYARRALKGCREGGPPVETFRLGFPLDVFQPLDRKMCRRILGLPQDRFVLLVTSEFADRRKGVDRLLRTLRSLELPDLLLVSTSWSDPNPELAAAIEIKRLGYVTDPDRLAMIYSAADLMAGPSLEETFGQTFIEAIACGTPVVGFPAAGMRDAIVDNVTGRFSAGLGEPDLGAAILDLYRNPELRRDLACWGRLHVENQWSPLSAYRHFFLALNRLGLLHRFGVPPNITFLPLAPALPEPLTLAPQQARSKHQGLCPKEGPLPEYNLPEFQWALGPYTCVEIESPSEGRHLLAISYRNIHEDQVVTIDINGARLGERRLSFTNLDKGRLLTFTADLQRGKNVLGLEFSRWLGPQENERPLAIIVTKITAVPRATFSKAATA